MWLTSSSVGRKFIMALTGACLVLFVTFHCLMNSVAIVWPTAYNSICEFLGANWYALAASLGLAVLFIFHICYAVWLTLQNRKARGADRYSISRRPATVEWSSQNMLVLGIVILAFLVVHLIQFWAKMQLQEIRGGVETIPAAAGTLFLQEAFSLPWTLIVYIIGFIALWFHMNHGFWSMFQSVGWDSTVWIPRLKKIGSWWTGVVIALFIAQGIVFTVRAHEGYYKSDERLQKQYQEMMSAMIERDFGPDAAQQILPKGDLPAVYSQLDQRLSTISQEDLKYENFCKKLGFPEYDMVKDNPQLAMMGIKNAQEWDAYRKKIWEEQVKSVEYMVAARNFYGYLLDKEEKQLPATEKEAQENMLKAQ